MDLLSISRITSSRSSTCASGVPAGARNAVMSMISASSCAGNRSASPTSTEAQIMPKLATPRSLAFRISTGSPSPCQRTKEPGHATTTRMPGSRLEPPQTMSCSSPSSISTRQMRSLSALGCGSTSRMSPDTMPSKRRASSVTPSTSTVDMVRSYARFFRSMSAGI